MPPLGSQAEPDNLYPASLVATLPAPDFSSASEAATGGGGEVTLLGPAQAASLVQFWAAKNSLEFKGCLVRFHLQVCTVRTASVFDQWLRALSGQSLLDQ